MAPQWSTAAPADRPVGHDDERSSEDAISAFVKRLSRQGPDGRQVIERAAIMAEGATASAILDWLAAASWVPEDVPAAGSDVKGLGGLHAMRQESQRELTRPQAPRRYVSPPVRSAM